MSSNREYDEERKPPDNHDDNSDISPSGTTSSSYHLNCTSNFFSGRSESQNDEIEIEDCEEFSQNISGDDFRHMLSEMEDKLKEHCKYNEPNVEKKLQLEQEINQNHVVRLAKFHMKCKKHPNCPLQTLKRRFRHFISNSKCKKKSDKLSKPCDANHLQ